MHLIDRRDRMMQFIECTPEVESLARTWADRLTLANQPLRVTTSRRRFQEWLGRRVDAQIGGAYVFLPDQRVHAILVNLPRIDTEQPRALEIVVCEELLHMRHRLDGDRRRHAKHGYDRIARQVAELTGASIDDVRGALLPVQRRPYRYRYECPTCKQSILRRRRGLWSCGLCAPRFSNAHVLQLVEVLDDSSMMIQQALS